MTTTGDAILPVQPLDSGAPIVTDVPPPPLPPSTTNLPTTTDVPAPVPVPVPLPPVVSATPIKPGVQTTEFWLTAVVSLVCAIAGIVLFVTHRIDQGAFVTLLLAALGGGSIYTVLRSYLKKAGINLPGLPGDPTEPAAA